MKARALIEAEEYNKDELLSLLRGQRIWIATIEFTDNDPNPAIFASQTHAGLIKQLARYCLRNWRVDRPSYRDPDIIDNPSAAERAFVDAYFREVSDEEWLTIEQVTLSEREEPGRLFYAGIIRSQKGTQLLTSSSYEGLCEKLAEWCRQRWRPEYGEPPAERQTLVMATQFFRRRKDLVLMWGETKIR